MTAKIYILGFLALSLIISLSTSLWYFKNAYEDCILERTKLESALKIQNEAINKLKLDKESYQKNLFKQEKTIKAKYETIKSKDLATCEAREEEIKKLVVIFNAKERNN